jgi:hypothetical protein
MIIVEHCIQKEGLHPLLTVFQVAAAPWIQS